MSLNLDWTDEQLEEAGLDRQQVLSIARRLAKLGSEMQELGLSVYGNGSGYLVHSSQPTHVNGGDCNPDAVIADLGRGFDGGDW